MEKQNRTKHQKIKLALKILGPTFITIGFIFLLIGFVNVIKSIGEFPQLFWCLMVAIVLDGIGLILTLFGFKKEITTYVKNESVPVINEYGKEIQPAVNYISHATKIGLPNEIICTCGTPNEKDSKFCRKCGKKLTITCPKCGNENRINSNFCDNCGEKLQ